MNTEATDTGVSQSATDNLAAAQTPQNQQGGADQGIEQLRAEQAALKAELEAIKTFAETQKKEISGRDSKITELSKQLKELSKNSMTEEEIRQAREREITEELEKVKREKDELIRSGIVSKALSDAGLKSDFASFITGRDEQTISEQVKILSENINHNATEQKQKEINSILGGQPPQKGTQPQNNDLQSLYNNAKSKNDIAMMNAIKRKAASEGVIIN